MECERGAGVRPPVIIARQSHACSLCVRTLSHCYQHLRMLPQQPAAVWLARWEPMRQCDVSRVPGLSQARPESVRSSSVPYRLAREHQKQNALGALAATEERRRRMCV